MSSKGQEYVLAVVVSDEGVSCSISHEGEECSWEDNARNWLSVGAQYIVFKMI